MIKDMNWILVQHRRGNDDSWVEGRMRFSLILILLITIVISAGIIGCGTMQTMPTLGRYGSPKVYSGTRLDFNAVRGNDEGLRTFTVKAPAYPLPDLPFSVILDTFMLPLTLPVATYEFIFEQ